MFFPFEPCAAFVLMEYLKGNVKNFSHIPGMVKTANLLDGCNLSQFKLGAILSIEELKACIGVDETKRRAKRYVKSQGTLDSHF